MTNVILQDHGLFQSLILYDLHAYNRAGFPISNEKSPISAVRGGPSVISVGMARDCRPNEEAWSSHSTLLSDSLGNGKPLNRGSKPDGECR